MEMTTEARGGSVTQAWSVDMAGLSTAACVGRTKRGHGASLREEWL